MTRSLLAAALAFLAAVALVLAGIAGWTTWTALSTPRFVALAGPVIDQPGVRSAIATSLGDQLSSLVGRSEIRPIAVREVGAVLASPGFRPVWYAALTVAHQDVVTALTGPEGAVTTVHGEVTADLIAVVGQVLRQLPPSVTALLGGGRTLLLPAGESSAGMRAAIGHYLGRPLPAGFATVPVIDAAALSHARTGVQLFEGSVPVFGASGLALLAAALLAGRRRLRVFAIAAIWVGAGSALAYLGLQRVGALAVDAVPASAVRPAVVAVVQALFDGLRTPAVAVCAGAAVLAVGALLAGAARPDRVAA